MQTLSSGLGPYWVDQLWHDMRAQNRTRVIPEELAPRGPRHLTPEQEQRRRDGLVRYQARRRAARGSG